MTSVAKRDKWCKHRVSPQKTRDNPFLAFWQSRRIIYGGSSKSMEPKPRVKDVQYCLLEGNCHSSLKHIYQFSGSLTPQNDKCTLDQPWLAGKSFTLDGFLYFQSFIQRHFAAFNHLIGYSLSHGLSLIPRSCVQIPSWSWKPWSVAWSSLHFF